LQSATRFLAYQSEDKKGQKEINMNRRFAHVSILVLGSAVAAFAQNPQAVMADVPFDFSVAGATMPAGHYVIDAKGATTITLHAVDNGKNAIATTTSARTLDPQKDARLVFHRYGNQYFLHQVWITGLTSGRELPASKQESNLAKGPANSKRVIIVASN
jgi:hypothetical protein